jgi:hypothetical protein
MYRKSAHYGIESASGVTVGGGGGAIRTDPVTVTSRGAATI